MQLLTSKEKLLKTVLLLLIVVHTVLSFFNCVEIVTKHYLLDWAPSVRTEGLMAGWVTCAAALRICLLLHKRRIPQIIACLISVSVSVTTGFSIAVYHLVDTVKSGLVFTDHRLTPLGTGVLILSWVITAAHIGYTSLVCRRGSAKKERSKVKTALTWTGIVTAILLLIIFRNVILDWIRHL